MAFSFRRRWAAWLAGFLVLLLIGFSAWWFISPRPDGIEVRPPKPRPDLIEVLHLNNVGVGHMEKYKYADAIDAFEAVVEKDPDWTPGRVNLGIALFNQGGSEAELRRLKGLPLTGAERANTDRAMAQFKDILDKSEGGPKYKLYAHFCLGIILFDLATDFEEARRHFKEVVDGDPTDVGGLVFYGDCLLFVDPDANQSEALEVFQRAVRLDPYNLTALYKLERALRKAGQIDRADAALREQEDLRAAETFVASKTEYGKMGKYAEVIGTEPANRSAKTGPLPLFTNDGAFKITLAPGVRWATSADFGAGPAADLLRAVRQRFGATLITLDYDGDGRPDLLLLAAVIENGQVGDLLLHNDGSSRFSDVTAAAGLAGVGPSLGCCAGDLDNDGKPDLILTGIGKQRAFRNTGKGFEEVSARLGLDKVTAVCLGAALVDLDQDGDLDLILARYGDTPEQALAALNGPAKTGPGFAVFLNASQAPPGPADKPARPYELAFRFDAELSKKLGPARPAVALAAGDFDQDRDLDLFLLADGGTPVVAANDRLLRFRQLPLPDSLAAAGGWNGALVLDVNHDERSDLFLVGPGRRPLLLVNRIPKKPDASGEWFAPGPTDAPPMLQAQTVDVDLDGWSDVIGLSEKHQPVLLHNEAGKLAHVPHGFGADGDWPGDLVAVAAADVDGDCFPDVLLWSEKDGVQLRRNHGTTHRGLIVDLTGARDKGNKMRCNADAHGAWAMAQSYDLVAMQELTTFSAGLGQSRQPIVLGLGDHDKADVLRIRWPDGVLQAELELPACEKRRIPEVNRESISCPLLFAWDGERFAFITDFLGAGALGECLYEGGTRPPRPEESVKVEAGQLRPLDGQYVFKMAQPMDEATYIDRLELMVIDHPPGVDVYPDERFVDAPPYPSQELLALKPGILPIRARDHRGRDVTDLLARRDRRMVDDFLHRPWLGYAEDHAVELDFGDRLAKFGATDRLFLVAAGWTDYPYPESIWAATQAGVPLQAPVLERQGDNGQWTPLLETGFPAGLPRVMTCEVTGKLGGPRCVFRLRTNMQIYWDQICVAALAGPVGSGSDAVARATPLAVQSARLAPRAHVKQFSPDGKKPVVYDYDQAETVPVVRLEGKMTRFGDVTDLLKEEDDCFVIFGPGDELDVRFDARGLPELPRGWTRSFVLRTWGYCKDCAPFTASGRTIEPLPFRGMRNYPYGPEETYPRDEKHQAYERKVNTRRIGR